MLVKKQLLVTAVVGAVALLAGLQYGLAALSGGLIATLASVVTVLMAFKSGRAYRPKEMLAAFNAGLALKYFVVILGFGLVSWIFKPPFFPLIAGFVAAYSVYWFALKANLSTKG